MGISLPSEGGLGSFYLIPLGHSSAVGYSIRGDAPILKGLCSSPDTRPRSEGLPRLSVPVMDRLEVSRGGLLHPFVAMVDQGREPLGVGTGIDFLEGQHQTP